MPAWGGALSATLIVQIASSFAGAAIPLMGPLLTARWGLQPTDIGYVSTLISMGICWFLACGSPMLENYGPIRTLQIGLGFIGVGILFLLQPGGTAVWAGALMVGLGLAPNTPAGSQLLLRTSPPRHRSLIFSIRQAGVPLGGVVAGLLVAPIIGQYGIEKAVMTVAALVLVSIALVQPFQRTLDVEAGPKTKAWPISFLTPFFLARTMRALKTHPTLPVLTLFGMSFSLTQACVTAFTATYLVVEQGKSLSQAGAYVAVLLSSSAVARIGFGWLADRTGNGLSLLGFLSLGSACALMLLTWMTRESNVATVTGCMMLVGATTMGWNGVHMAELARVSPRDSVGEVTSGANLFGFVGSICGPLAFAALIGATGSFAWAYIGISMQLALFGAGFLIIRRAGRCI